MVQTYLPMDKLEYLFERLAGESSIFLNHDVLRHDFIPNYLPHRDDETLRFGAVLAPVLKNLKCSNLFIYGKTGTGKTAVTRCVLDRLFNKSIEIRKKIRVCYVNCRTAATEYRIVASMCSELGIKVPFTGLATAEILKRFKTNLENQGTPFIIALDEVDLLVRNYGDDILYTLTRFNEEIKNGKLIIVGISNDLYFKDLLDPRVLSSLSEEEIVFKPYTAEQIRDILYQRVQLAFKNGAMPDSTLNLCAALAATEHGDARRALDLIRVSGEIAERNGDNIVKESHVREAQKKIEHDRIYEALKSLPLQSKALLYLISTQSLNQDISTGSLYNSYRIFCNEIGIETLTQRRVSSLLNELTMFGVINTQVANLGRYGRTKKFKLNVPFSTLKRVFSEDSILSAMFNQQKQ